MTWKEKRIVTILGTILGLLAVALLIVTSIRYRQHRQELSENITANGQGVVVSNDEYFKLEINNGSFAPTFAKNEAGRWTWADEPDFPLNPETVEAILELLDHPQPQQTLPMEGGPEAYELDNPRASVTATRGDGSTRALQLGKATTDGASYYAMLDGDETTVYILPGTLYDLLKTPVYAMMNLPQLPQLTAERLTAITIQGQKPAEGEAPVVLLQARDGGQVWQSGDKDVTSHPQVQALLEDLQALTLDRCVDFNPSEEAVEICGFLNPTATLTVQYLSDSDTEQELTVTIGTRVADGSGRYIRVGSDTTIYFLPTELLDPLMSISSQGLN